MSRAAHANAAAGRPAVARPAQAEAPKAARPAAYLKVALPEFAVLAVAASALACTVACGFEAAALLDGGPWPLVALVCGVLAALYAVAYSRVTLKVGVPLLVLACAGAVAAAVAAAGGANVFADAPDAAAVLAAVGVLVAVGSFAAARTKAGCALLAVAGCLACAVAELLFGEGRTLACAVFVGASAVLYLYRSYVVGLGGTQTRTASFAAAALTCAGAALAAVLLALGTYAWVVEPLQPPTRDLVLVTRYRSLEELPRLGVNQELAVTDPDLTSVVVGDRIDYLEPEQAESDPEQADEQDAEEAAQSALQALASAVGYNLESIQQAFSAITHERVWWGWVLAVLAACALVALPFAVKLAARRRFYRAALALEPRAYVRRVYGRVERDLALMGVARPAAATPYEYADARVAETACFADNDARANFSFVACLAVKATYGREPIFESELRALDAFWRAFHKNCRAYLGRGRYLRLFFRL